MVLKRTIKVSDPELWQLCRAMETLRRRNPKREMPAQLFCVFMFIASAGGPVKCRDIEVGLGYNQSSTSRLTNDLYNKSRGGGPGLGWITKEYRGQDKVCSLTPLGESIAREFWETVYGQT